MVQDNRLVQEFQNNNLVFDIGAPPAGGGGIVSPSGTYGGQVMPYRQAPNGGLSDALAPNSGLATPGETDAVNKHPINRVCVFENEIHNIGQGKWHKQDETTGSWDLVFDLDDHNAHSSYQNIGLYPVFNQGKNTRHLVTAYYTTIANKWVGLSYNKDTNTVTSGSLSISSPVSQGDLSPQDCQLGNNIHFTGSNTDATVMTLDGLNLGITGSTFGNVARPVDLCAYSGLLYMAHKDSSVVPGSGVITISCMTPVWHPVLRIPFENTPYAVADTAVSVPRQKCLLFVDNNPTTASSGNPSMWLYYQNNPQITPVGLSQSSFEGAGTYGWSVWEIQGDGLGGLSVVQQKDTLMGTWRAGLAESVIPIGNADQGVISYCDNYPGWFVNSPEKSFLTMRPMGGEPGQTFKQWDFDPAGGAPSANCTIGGPGKASFSQDKIGGGSRWSPKATSTTTGLDVNIFDIVYMSGHMVMPLNVFSDTETVWRIHFKLMPSTAYHAGHSGTSPSYMSVRWYYDKFHSPNKRCTLTDDINGGRASHGTVTNGQINGLVINSGVDYWVDWHFREDNLTDDDRVYLCGLLFDPISSDIPPLGL
jgi:hypothetical protein